MSAPSWTAPFVSQPLKLFRQSVPYTQISRLPFSFPVQEVKGVSSAGLEYYAHPLASSHLADTLHTNQTGLPLCLPRQPPRRPKWPTICRLGSPPAQSLRLWCSSPERSKK